MAVFERKDGSTGLDVDALVAVYTAVFGLPPWSEPDASGLLRRLKQHRHRPGFGLVEAREQGVLVGFAYGYRGERGQHWTELVAGLIGEPRATELLGGHLELVELAVLPAARGRGIGGRLLQAMLAECPEPRVLLQTLDGDGPAMRLYERTGFTRLAERGEWVVLQRELPRAC